jgi:hypothetical protein
VLSLNPKNGKVERLDFAEKNRPAWLYLSPSDTTIVIHTNGYGETNKKFVAYRHSFGSAAEAQVVPMDELPSQVDQVTGRLLEGSKSVLQLDLQLPWNK